LDTNGDVHSVTSTTLSLGERDARALGLEVKVLGRSEGRLFFQRGGSGTRDLISLVAVLVYLPDCSSVVLHLLFELIEC
jgi:hypothetical protein